MAQLIWEGLGAARWLDDQTADAFDGLIAAGAGRTPTVSFCNTVAVLAAAVGRAADLFDHIVEAG